MEVSYTYTQSYTYDITGNMLRKTSTSTVSPSEGINTLNYDKEYSYYGDKPKQAERIGNLYYLYDGNGNIMEEREGGHSPEGIMGSGSITKTGEVSVYNRGIGLVRGNDTTEEVYKRTFSWDEENRLTGTMDPAYNVEYRYDYSGQRTNKKTANGKETLYYNSMWLESEDSPTFR